MLDLRVNCEALTTWWSTVCWPWQRIYGVMPHWMLRVSFKCTLSVLSCLCTMRFNQEEIKLNRLVADKLVITSHSICLYTYSQGLFPPGCMNVSVRQALNDWHCLNQGGEVAFTCVNLFVTLWTTCPSNSHWNNIPYIQCLSMSYFQMLFQNSSSIMILFCILYECLAWENKLFQNWIWIVYLMHTTEIEVLLNGNNASPEVVLWQSTLEQYIISYYHLPWLQSWT